MYKKLLEELRRPARYQRSEAAFWDDEHISKQMLAVHLNPDWEAASRKLDDIERSVSWIVAQLRPGQSILDLGCGPGLYTKRFAAAGLRVTGVDLSRRSLDYAAAQDPQSRYLRKNYVTDELPGTEGGYDAITLIYCDYAALIDTERRALLARVKSLLKPGGLFLFDVFTPLQYEGLRESKTWSLNEEGGFWSAQPHLDLEASYAYEGGVWLQQSLVLTAEGVREYLIWDTVFTRESIAAELDAGGFDVLDCFDDATGAPYTGKSNTLCVKAGVKGENVV